MPDTWEEMGAGLKVRKDTPKKVELTEDFVRDITKGSDSRVFIDKVKEIADADSAG